MSKIKKLFRLKGNQTDQKWNKIKKDVLLGDILFFMRLRAIISRNNLLQLR